MINASGNSHNLWFWDLFFITDYLIIGPLHCIGIIDFIYQGN